MTSLPPPETKASRAFTSSSSMNMTDQYFAPVNKAIFARDFKTFDKEYMKAMKSCNDCHAAMGYSFIKVVKMNAPADNSIAYTGSSKAEDVPK